MTSSGNQADASAALSVAAGGASVPIDGYDLLGYRAAVGAAPHDAHMAVRSVLRGFGPVDVGPGLNLPRYELFSTDAGWHVRVNGAIVHTDGDFANALVALEWHVISAALDRRDDLFHLHGAALSLPMTRAGIVLAGDSGNGKTTLTLALMLRGFVPFGDDVALLDPATFEPRALRRAFHVDAQVWRVLEPLAGGPIGLDSDGPPGHFSPPQWAERGVPIKWVLFPQYHPDNVPELTRMPLAESAAALLTHSISVTKNAGTALRTVARLAESAACYRLRTGDLATSVALIQQLVAGAGAAGPARA